MEGKRGKKTRSTKDDVSSETVQGKGPWYVIADTHLGLAPNRDDVELSEEMCDPKPLGQFMNWLTGLKTYELPLYDPDGNQKNRDRPTKELLPPGKLIMLGDMYDLWDSTDWEAEFCGRGLFNPLDRLDCDKIYIIGNHDISIRSLVGVYASGKGEMRILDKPYYTELPNKKQGVTPEKDKDKLATPSETGRSKYLFMHGQEFEPTYTVPLWKHVDILRLGAQALGDYWSLPIFFTVLGLLLYLGFNLGAWLSIFLLSLLYESYSQKWVVYSWLLLLPLFLWILINEAYPSVDFVGRLVVGAILAIVGFAVLLKAKQGTTPRYLQPRRRRDSFVTLILVCLFSTIISPIVLFLSPNLNSSIAQYLYPMSGIAILSMFIVAMIEHFAERRKDSLIPRFLVWLIIILEFAFLATFLVILVDESFPGLVPMQQLEQSFSPIQQFFLGLQQILENIVLRELPFRPLWSMPLFAIWLVLALPRIVYKCGIHLIRTLGSIRYDYSTHIGGISSWLYCCRRMRGHLRERVFFEEGVAPPDDDLSGFTLVYGHTHIIDEWHGDIRKKESPGEDVCLNVPSWVKDGTRGEEIRREVRNAFLYIDPDSRVTPHLFLGWDSAKNRPFHIPFHVLDEIRWMKEGTDRGVVEKKKKEWKIERMYRYIETDTGVELLKCDWPLKMMLEWIGWFNCALEGMDIEKKVMDLIERKAPISEDKVPPPDEIVETRCCKKLLHYKDIEDLEKEREKEDHKKARYKNKRIKKETKYVECPLRPEEWKGINRQNTWLRSAHDWQETYNEQ